MLIVGYGNDAGTGKDYWLLQNSWGSKWGEGGFMRIERGVASGLGLCGLACMHTVYFCMPALYILRGCM